MKRLRVVQVYKAFPPVRGGIEGHVDLLAGGLARRGVGAEVLCARVPGTLAREERAGVEIRRCPSLATVASTPLPPMLPIALWRSAADIVHLHYPWPPGELAYVLGGRQRPLVVTVHCEVVRQLRLAQWLHPLTQHVLRTARIIVTSEAMRGIPLLRQHRGRVDVIPLGVDLQRFQPSSSSADPLPQVPRPRVLFVGELRYYKGLDVLAAAMSKLPQAHLVVVGDGPERGRLKAALRECGCAERAHLLGRVSDENLVAIFRNVDVVALPSTSRAEAFGLSVAEAQACGVPAVTTDVGTGTRLTVADGHSGRVVAPNDPGRLAEAIAWCLDPVRLGSLKDAARTHAEQHLSADDMVERTLDLYATLLTTP